MRDLKNSLKRYPRIYGPVRGVALAVFRPAHALKLFRQHLRESILQRTLSSLGPDVYFIQVGSNDGKTGDPLFENIKKNDWHGIAIEPVPHLFRKLQATYEEASGVECLNIAIAPNDDDLKFFTVPEDIEALVGEELPDWADQLSSFKRENLEKHLDGKLTPHIIELNVKCATLSDLIDERGLRRVDVLHIDAEGFDYEVFRTFPFPELKPRVIIIEHRHMAEGDLRTLQADLRESGYETHLLERDVLAVLGS